MVKGDGIISGMAQYGNDTYRLSFVYDEEEDEQILNDFFGTMHFGDAEFNADNDLSMGNMQYVLPERDYVSMYSDLRVWSDGEISYIGIQYELGYPNFASMYFFPGSTIESRVYDEYEETEVNDLRDRMVEYVNRRFPKNPMYGRVVEQYLKYGYGTRVIGEKLGIKERAARFFLDQAKPVAAEYYNRFGR